MKIKCIDGPFKDIIVEAGSYNGHEYELGDEFTLTIRRNFNPIKVHTFENMLHDFRFPYEQPKASILDRKIQYIILKYETGEHYAKFIREY
jgi:hypothetical protein